MARLSHTHTFVTLAVSPAAYEEIKILLEKADYGHAFIEDFDDGLLIDMQGIALAKKADGT